MSKEELKQEVEEKLPQAELDYCHGFMNPCEPNELPYIELIRFRTGFERGYLAGAEPREKRIEELEAENERTRTKYYELQDTLKKVRLALIKERTANIMNYGKGGVEMFNDCFEILKGVSN